MRVETNAREIMSMNWTQPRLVSNHGSNDSTGTLLPGLNSELGVCSVQCLHVALKRAEV